MEDYRQEDSGSKSNPLKGPMGTDGKSQGRTTTSGDKSVPDPLGLTKALKDNK